MNGIGIDYPQNESQTHSLLEERSLSSLADGRSLPSSSTTTTKQTALQLIILACICDMLGSNLRRVTGYPQVFRGFTYSLQENSGAVLHLGHDRFILSPFEFAIHLSSYHTTLYNLYTETYLLNNRSK